MVKKLVLALVVVLLLAGVAFAGIKDELIMREPEVDNALLRDNINPATVENIVGRRMHAAEIRNTFSRDAYVFWFDEPGEFCSFCVSGGVLPYDMVYVALVPSGQPPFGLNFQIQQNYTVMIDENMTFDQLFNALKQEMDKVCAGPVSDTWVYMALKMLLSVI